MENLMIPAMPPVSDPAARPEVKAGGRAEKSSSFSDYLERKMVAEPAERKNLLGAGRNKAARAAEKNARPADGAADDAAEKASLHALFGQFLADIRGQAKEADAGPGAWTLALPDGSLLTRLAADAGMGEAESAALLRQFEENQGVIELDSLLASLVNHFQASQNEQPVSVAETELPLLELILERMGVPAEQIQQIGEHAVTGDNQLDLARFLEALGGAQATQPTKLSALESEQLQNLLDEAGVSRLMQRALLPERHTPWDNPNQPHRPVTMTLDRLRNLLTQGMQDIADHRRKPDFPNLIADLKAIFAESGFAEKTVGWSPAVQKAMEDAYQAVLENVDLAAVRMEKAAPRKPATGTGAELTAFPDETATEETAPEPIVFAGAEKEKGAPLMAGKERSPVPLAAEEQAGRQQEGAAAGLVREHEPVVASGEAPRPEPATVAREVRTPHHAPRLAPALEQQTFERLSEGVIRGLRSNEHHLVLRLYPKELGEVKVEMMVRDNHVALSFAMENSRVKEVLEKNMDMFQQNLEQQGFTLEECMVSVNHQHDDTTDAWRQFVQAWQERRGDDQRTSLAEVAGDVLYLRPAPGQGREAGIDLFA
ncbi:MAG: flagellar hook-length control protein FliK [Thermodesulfobacteriota bacterium]